MAERLSHCLPHGSGEFEPSVQMRVCWQGTKRPCAALPVAVMTPRRPLGGTAMLDCSTVTWAAGDRGVCFGRATSTSAPAPTRSHCWAHHASSLYLSSTGSKHSVRRRTRHRAQGRPAHLRHRTAVCPAAPHCNAAWVGATLGQLAPQTSGASLCQVSTYLCMASTCTCTVMKGKALCIDR